MNTKIQRQMLADLLCHRCNASKSLSILERSVFFNSSLLEIFFGCRSSYYSQGKIDPDYIKTWLASNARSAGERGYLCDMINELMAMPPQTVN